MKYLLSIIPLWGIRLNKKKTLHCKWCSKVLKFVVVTNMLLQYQSHSRYRTMKPDMNFPKHCLSLLFPNSVRPILTLSEASTIQPCLIASQVLFVNTLFKKKKPVDSIPILCHSWYTFAPLNSDITLETAIFHKSLIYSFMRDKKKCQIRNRSQHLSTSCFYENITYMLVL
jgi:hypothetical protein